jgi:hypothetical protein
MKVRFEPAAEHRVLIHLDGSAACMWKNLKEQSHRQ